MRIIRFEVPDRNGKPIDLAEVRQILDDIYQGIANNHKYIDTWMVEMRHDPIELPEENGHKVYKEGSRSWIFYATEFDNNRLRRIESEKQ